MDKRLVKYIILMVFSIPINILYNICVEKFILFFYDEGEIFYSPGFSFVCNFLGIVLCCFFIIKYIYGLNDNSKSLRIMSVFLLVIIIFLLIYPLCEVWVINEDTISQNLFGKEISTYLYNDVSSVKLDVVSTGMRVHSLSLRYQIFFTNNTSQEFIISHAFTKSTGYFISFDKIFSSKRILLILNENDVYNACSNIGFSNEETYYFTSIPFTRKVQNDNYGIILFAIVLFLFNSLTFRRYIRIKLSKKEIKGKNFFKKILFIYKFKDINKFLWLGNFFNNFYSIYLIFLYIINFISKNNYFINYSIIISFILLSMDFLAFFLYEKRKPKSNKTD